MKIRDKLKVALRMQLLYLKMAQKAISPSYPFFLFKELAKHQKLFIDGETASCIHQLSIFNSLGNSKDSPASYFHRPDENRSTQVAPLRPHFQ
jgi:hypothetical protein